MYAAFTAHAGLRSVRPEPNQIPLTLGAPGYPSTLTAAAKHATARRAGRLPQAGDHPGEHAWRVQRLEGSGSRSRVARVTSTTRTCQRRQLNRYDWYSAHDW